MKLSEMIAKYEAEQAYLSKLQEAIKSEDFDLMKHDGLTGDNLEARMTEVETRKTANEELGGTIRKLQAFQAPNALEKADPAPSSPASPATPAVAEPTVYAQPKKDITDPAYEFAKAMFDNQDLRDWASGKVNHFQKTVTGEFDLAKATLTGAGTIEAAPVQTAITTPLSVMDTLFVMPWGSEVYRRRVVPRATAGIEAPDAPLHTGLADDLNAAGTSNDFALQTIGVAQPIANRAIMADPSVMAAIAGMLIEDLRVELQGQVLAGTGATNMLTSIASQIGAARTSAVTADTDILSHPTLGLEQGVLGVRGRGGEGNYIYLNAADIAKAYTALTMQHSAFIRDKATPYGAPMGASIVLAPQLPANTGLVVSMGSPRFHVVPVMGTVMVEISRDEQFSRDNTVMRATLYCTSVVQNPQAYQAFTGTGNWRIDVPPSA